MKTILFVDWENFRKKIKEVLEFEKKLDFEWHNFDFEGLFKLVLNGISIDEIRFYAGKLEQNQQTLQKSQELIQSQRLLKNTLEAKGFNFIYAGKVRQHGIEFDSKGKQRPSFKEKGVDVKIAVDMLATAYDKDIDQCILASSDSDLQPAVREIKLRGAQVIYLGFEQNPNKGLSYTTDRTILIRNAEIIKFMPHV